MKKGIVLLLLVALFQSCTPVSDCENELISTLNNGDNTQSLFVFTRDCGATTSKSIQLSLLNKGVSLNETETGNIFIADGKPTLESYKKAVSTKWIGKKLLEVQFDKKLRVFKKDSVRGSIPVKYLPK